MTEVEIRHCISTLMVNISVGEITVTNRIYGDGITVDKGFHNAGTGIMNVICDICVICYECYMWYICITHMNSCVKSCTIFMVTSQGQLWLESPWQLWGKVLWLKCYD